MNHLKKIKCFLSDNLSFTLYFKPKDKQNKQKIASDSYMEKLPYKQSVRKPLFSKSRSYSPCYKECDWQLKVLLAFSCNSE